MHRVWIFNLKHNQAQLIRLIRLINFFFTLKPYNSKTVRWICIKLEIQVYVAIVPKPGKFLGANGLGYLG